MGIDTTSDMDERRAVREAYDEMADIYGERETSETRPEPLKRFLGDLDAGDRLLDAGCGQGETLAAADATGVGLDFSLEQLRRARKRTDAALVQGDMTTLPFADDAFDAACALYSLIHVPLEEHRTVIDEFARVLRPGGTLLVTEGECEWVGSNPDWLDSGSEMRWEIAGEDATREDLRAAGFDVRGTWSVPDPTTEDGTKPFFLAER